MTISADACEAGGASSAYRPRSGEVPTRPLLIAGLRRSGTTALWGALRAHQGLVAFDEPFHPRLWQGARESTKGTWAELTALWRDFPSDFVPGVRAIDPLGELDRAVDSAQAAYLAGLLAQNGGHVVVDVVRTWNKLPGLVSVTPSPFVVQLVRSPVPWALSHLIPSGRGSWRKPIGDALRRVTALKRRSHFDNWQYEAIITKALATNHPIWKEVAIAPERIAASPAYIKLLAFWWAANRTMANDLADVAPDRHRVLLAEDFMASPDTSLGQLLASAGLPSADLDTSNVHPARNDPLQHNPAFAAAFEILGIPRTLLPAAQPNSKTLVAAFSIERAAS